jgi:protein arginine N-methyltransferase 7
MKNYVIQLQPEATVVPSLARVWALPIQSKELRKFTDLPASIKKLPFFEGCPGCASVFDLQASALKPDVDFLSACPPFVVFSFNFSDPDSLIFDETFTNTFEIVNKVVTQLDAVIVWWELDMLGDSSTIINLAPEWQDPRASWRDHWMQCIYFFPESLPVVRGEIEVFNLHSFHDEFRRVQIYYLSIFGITIFTIYVLNFTIY